MKLKQLFIAGCVATSAVLIAIAPSIAAPARVMGKQPGSVVNMRSGPSTNNRVVAQSNVGKSITIIDQVQGKDGYTWYQVSSGNRTGWMRGDFVRRIETGCGR